MEYKICVLLLTEVIFSFSYVRAIDLSFRFGDGSTVKGNEINVREGTRLELECVYYFPKPTWLRENAPSFRIISDVLKIDSFHLSHQGKYICSAPDPDGILQQLSVQINCLYPPERPELFGQREVIFRKDFTLTCNTSSFPSAAIWWTLYWNENATVIGRGEKLVFSVQEDTYAQKIYCWAENTMRPSEGEPVQTKLVSYKNMFVHKPAYIYGLSNQYKFYVGHTLDIKCEVTGEPEPEIYWTKDGDTSFSYYGYRLFQQNVQKSFAGYYACHANNQVVNGDKASDMKNTLVIIEDLSIPSDCQNFCTSDNVTPCESETPTTETTLKTTIAVTQSPSKESCDSSCSHVIIAFAVIGWLVAVILIIVGMFCWIKCRDNTAPEKKSGTIPSIPESDTRQNSCRREPPELPYNRLERDPTVAEHIYKQMEENNSAVVNTQNQDRDHTKVKVIENADLSDVEHKYLTLEDSRTADSDIPTSTYSQNYLTPISGEEKKKLEQQ